MLGAYSAFLFPRLRGMPRGVVRPFVGRFVLLRSIVCGTDGLGFFFLGTDDELSVASFGLVFFCSCTESYAA